VKTRNGFVSNSSSASFIIISGPIVEGCDFYMLKKHQAYNIIRYIESRKEEPEDVDWTDEDVYLTSYISDGGELYYNIEKRYKAYLYTYGNHGYPYCSNDYNRLRSGVWILKEYDEEIE
jgi:hypothetical protein